MISIIDVTTNKHVLNAKMEFMGKNEHMQELIGHESNKTGSKGVQDVYTQILALYSKHWAQPYKI